MLTGARQTAEMSEAGLRKAPGLVETVSHLSHGKPGKHPVVQEEERF